jgi:SAM-dependent methyltransferase
MLAVARRTAPGVTWVEGVAERMPFEDDSVDRLLCQFALMFFTDADAAAREMRRVLRPDGRAVVATWAEASASPGYDALVGLIRRVAGDEPAEALLAPFRIGTPAELEAILAPALGDVRVETVTGEAHFPSLESWLTTEIRAWTLDEMITDEQLYRLLAEAPDSLGRFRAPDGTVSFPVPALVATGSSA